jgi:hypothetical protein
MIRAFHCKSATMLFLMLGIALHSEPMKLPKEVFGGQTFNVLMDHPGNYPFPTDMTFRRYADHIVDITSEEFDPSSVKRGDVVFLADWYIPWFMRYAHPKIQEPYILLSNDSDQMHPDPGILDYEERNGWPIPIEATRTLLYDAKVSFWFCKNMIFSRHPKIMQIPIGQNIIYWDAGGKNYLHILEQKTGLEKLHLLGVHMQGESNPVRPKLIRQFENAPYCSLFTVKGTVSKEEYYDELAKSMFTLAPPGYGLDTVRFWESFVLDCIPIVRHSDLDDLYKDLPVLFVHEWEEVNESFLRQKYEEIAQKNISKEKAYYDYWKAKIQEVQKQVREGSNSFSSVESTKFKPDSLQKLISLIQKHASNLDCLLCKGASMGLRPFELAQALRCTNTIFVQDRWGALGHEDAAVHLRGRIKDSALLASHKIRPINAHDNPYAMFSPNSQRKMHLFLDLAYRRHTLPEDLEEAFLRSCPQTVICGSQGQDPYVREVLEKFMGKRGVSIEFDGEIWFFVK